MPILQNTVRQSINLKNNIPRMLFVILLTVLASACCSLYSADDVVIDKAFERDFVAALNSSGRPDTDKQRDRQRKPQKVMQFAEIKAGMTVLDLIAAGGYYTEVLSHRVGNAGKVFAHNTEFVRKARSGAFEKELSARLANQRLDNVSRLDQELPDIAVPEQVDRITMVLNYHDFYVLDESQRQVVLQRLYDALKPDGKFLIIDADAKAGPHQPKLHRIHRQQVIDDMLASGFLLSKEATFLHNPDDDLSQNVFAPEIRGNTHRFVFLFAKQQEPNMDILR